MTNNPALYSLYTSGSIHDLDMGYLMLQVSSGSLHLWLQLEQCTNLTEGVWVPAGDAVEWQIPAVPSKAFFRVRGEE